MSEPLLPSDPSRVAGFRLLRRLGAGGMGVVYLGRTDTGTPAAVKVVRSESAADAGFRARFAREAELARRVDSPWVVPVLDADAQADAPWLATAFVPGPSLTEAVAAHGPLPTRSARVLGRLLAEALARVHAAGLVHRDVKPGNVLLALDGPRLIDFGIARADDDTALTASGLIVGTPGFLAPEQARGEPAGPASDVFALGGVLVHATTGRPPFGTGEPTPCCTARSTTSPTSTRYRRRYARWWRGAWPRRRRNGPRQRNCGNCSLTPSTTPPGSPTPSPA
ncbi:serine/threonine protein kinase [Streptomyces antibioticus]|nr:serine/threonine-protein kinase [Streptomyces antibioticus]MCX4737647.1 serine/threonine protein kinase [Streptomyces antibioticus]